MYRLATRRTDGQCGVDEWLRNGSAVTIDLGMKTHLSDILLLTQARQVQRLDVLVESLGQRSITAHTVHRLTHAVELTGQLGGHLTPRLPRDRLRSVVGE